MHKKRTHTQRSNPRRGRGFILLVNPKYYHYYYYYYYYFYFYFYYFYLLLTRGQ